MSANIPLPDVVQRKLAAFEEMQSAFEECFSFKQDVHGQKRFASFPVHYTVYYLHALWLCECKDRLLSVYKNIQRYEGRRCLELLGLWQEGDTASVVDFLNRKLDMLPLGDVTRSLQEARHLTDSAGLVRRLEHGRLVLLNRGLNLMQALDAIFSQPESHLLQEVAAACEQYGHTPTRLAIQLVELESDLYTFKPHQALAQQNILVMNRLGISVTNLSTDHPGDRSWRVLTPVEPLQPYAEQVIEGYQQMVAPYHNNLRGLRFIDRLEHTDTMTL